MSLLDSIPVILPVYARPDHLERVLAALRANEVPLILAFADGSKGEADRERVATVRRLLRAVDWCELRIEERPTNVGLGRNILSAVSAVAAHHEAFVVWEDDLVAVPGAYRWVTSALRHYRDEPQAMSVTAWTHPRVVPPGLNGRAYFDGRAECWVWGTYARSWQGMEQTAREKMDAVMLQGLPVDAYGSDLPRMARDELRRNIWAVRWLYHHLQHRGLCLRPPFSLVEHIGFDASATNAGAASAWANPPLPETFAIALDWPAVAEHPACRARWVAANPPTWRDRLDRIFSWR